MAQSKVTANFLQFANSQIFSWSNPHNDMRAWSIYVEAKHGFNKTAF